MDHTAIGDTANVAARLQKAAEPGTILLSETTGLLAQDFARVEPVGPLSLKGKDEPVSAYRLLGVSHRRSGLREFTSARVAAFVDRESELAMLNDFLQQVESGRSQAIGVVGEPGIGKSRLLVEFHRQLSARGVTWVEGRCLSYGTQSRIGYSSTCCAAIAELSRPTPRTQSSIRSAPVCKRSGWIPTRIARCFYSFWKSTISTARRRW